MIGGEGAKLRQYFQRPLPEVYPTGFAELDTLLDGGFRAGESTVLGGFTSHAKSALGEQIALHTSLTTPTLYLALELGRDLQRLRMGAKLARCTLGAMQRTGCDPITEGELNRRKLTIHTPRRRTLAMVERLIARRVHQVVIIDDCRNIDGVIFSGGHSDAHHIAARITEIAQENAVHVLALQQLDPKTYRLGANEWRFADSTVFEQRAYNSLTIFRPFRHSGVRQDYVAEIRLRKNRWGSAGKLHYRWQGETMSFWPFTEAEMDFLTCCASMRARAKKRQQQERPAGPEPAPATGEKWAADDWPSE